MINLMQAPKVNIYPPEQYITCLDLHFGWDKKRDLPLFRTRWSEGISMEDIATEMRRDPSEVVILAIDQSRRGEINPRPGGIFGRC